MANFLRWVVFVIVSTFTLAPGSGRADTPTRYECEINQKAASAAADAAIMSKHDLDKATAGLWAGGTCTAFLVLTGWFDFGVTAGICAVVTTTVVMTTPAEANATAATEAYKRVRDPRCSGT